MDLMRMEKKNAGDKYTSVSAILEDMRLLKSNAYLYNQGTLVGVSLALRSLCLQFSHLLLSPLFFPISLCFPLF